MKKTLALVLTVVLALLSVSALAADSPKPDNKNVINNVTDNEEKAAENKNNAAAPVYNYAPAAAEEGIELKSIEDTEESLAAIKLFKDALEAGDVLSPLPEDIVSKLPENRRNVDEILTTKFVGDVSKANKDQIFNISLSTAFEKDEGISIILCGLTGSPVYLLDATLKDDGTLDVKVPMDAIKAFGNNPFLLLVISE